MGYADDLVLITKGSNIELLVKDINSALEMTLEWLENKNFQLSLQKCEAIHFTKGTDAT